MKLAEYINEAKQMTPYEVVELVYNRSFPYVKEYLKYFRAEPRDGMMLSGRKTKDVASEKPIRKDRRPKDTPFEVHEMVDKLFHNNFGVYYRSNAVFTTGSLDTAEGYGTVYAIFPTGNNYSYCWSSDIKDLWSNFLEDGGYDMDEEEKFEQAMEHYGDEAHGEAYERLSDEAEEEIDRDEYYVDEEMADEPWFDEDSYQEAKDEYIDDRIQEYIEELVRGYMEDYNENSGDLDRLEDTISDYSERDLDDAINSGHEIMVSGKSYIMVRHDYLPYVMRYMQVHKTAKPTEYRFKQSMVGFNPSLYRVSKKDSVERHFKKYVNSDLLDMMNDLKK